MMTAAGNRADSRQTRHLDRRIALSGRAVAEFAPAVFSPSSHGPVGLDRSGMIVTSRDRTCRAADPGDARHLRGSRSPGRCAVAKLAVVVRAPGSHGPVRLDRERIRAARRDPAHTRQSRNLHRPRHPARGTIAELPAAVTSPAANAAVGPYGDGVRRVLGASCGGPDRPGHTRRLYRRRTAGRRAVAELAVAVIAPVPDGPVVSHRDGVDSAGSDPDDVRDPRDRDRALAHGPGPIAELTVVVCPPCGERRVVLEDQCMRSARRDGLHA